MKNIITQKNIPHGWDELELHEFADLIMGQSPSSESYNKNGEGLPFFQGNADFIKNSKYPVIRQWTTRPTKISESNSILFTVRAPVGDVFFNNTKACIGRGLASLNVKKGNSQIFLYYYLQSLGDQFKALSQGSTFTAINSNHLRQIKIIKPKSIKEQDSIANILVSVDDDIAKTQEVIEATEKMKHGLTQQLFTHGIGHTRFKKTKLGEIPESWSIVRIKDSTIKLIDGDRGANYPKQKDFSSDGHCLFLSAKNVSKKGFIFNELSFISRDKDESLRKGKLERGDIILTSRGTVGNVAYYSENVPFENIRINSGMLIIRHGNQFDPVFLYKYFTGPQMKAKYLSMGSGSAQPQLPIGSLELVEIPVLPIDEQKKIAEIISAIDEKISINKKLKAKLTKLKKGLMQDLLSGRVRTI